ncbi:MAG: methionyl-tRNA formyltransferase [bacterium]|nr:methionyl-tRNA formyltransferase [bacterium]MCP5068597.1 methionyl-tRNA formyltransferase [bacterium]
MALKIAYFGQAAFGRDVLVRLLESGHEIVGVYAPREGKRPDPLAEEALSRGLRLFRYGAMRRRGEPIAERVSEHSALGADLNVLAFVTMILPEAVVEAPRHGSLCFHPSLLPRFRGGNALAWQIIEGEREAGVSVFRPDAGIDTGPIVVQKGGVRIEDHHTAASLYFEQLYELGVLAMVEAVELVDRGEAEYRPQDESLASFQGLVDDEVAGIDWERPVDELDRRIRGCDPSPGAHTLLEGQEIRLFGVTRESGSGAPGEVVGHDDHCALVAAKGGVLRVSRVRLAGAGKQPAAEVLRIGAQLGG